MIRGAPVAGITLHFAASDVVHAALFLASPEADFITGEVLSVDGDAGTGRTYLPYGRTTT